MRFGVGGGSRVLRGGVSVGRGGVRGGVGSGPFSISGGTSSGSGAANWFGALIVLALLFLVLIAIAIYVGLFVIFALVLAPVWAVQLTLAYLGTAIRPTQQLSRVRVERVAYRRAKFIYVAVVFLPLYVTLLLLMQYNLSNTPDTEGCSVLGNFSNYDCYTLDGPIEWLDLFVSFATFSAAIIGLALLANFLVLRLLRSRMNPLEEIQTAPWSVSVKKLRADLLVIYRELQFHPRLPLFPDRWLVVPRWQGMPVETATAKAAQAQKISPAPTRVLSDSDVQPRKSRNSKLKREASLELRELNAFWCLELQVGEHKNLTEKRIRKYISHKSNKQRQEFLKLQCDDAMALARFIESRDEAQLEQLSPRRRNLLFGE